MTQFLAKYYLGPGVWEVRIGKAWFKVHRSNFRWYVYSQPQDDYLADFPTLRRAVAWIETQALGHEP